MGTGPRRRDSQRLWELDWLRLPPSTFDSHSSVSSAIVSAASSTTTFEQWHRRLCHLSGSRLSKLVGSGVLGPVSLESLLFVVRVASLVNSCNTHIRLVSQ